MANHIMLDFETLDTAPTAALLSIGAVRFDPRGTGIAERLELRPTLEDQTDILGRSVSEDTIRWWSEQNSAAIEEAMSDDGRMPIRDCMEQLYKFCWNQKTVWSNGSVFDVVIAESIFKQLDMSTPWPFYTIRDCRTIYDLAGVSLKDGGYVTTHRAIDDAIHQAHTVQRAYQKFIQAGFNHIK